MHSLRRAHHHGGPYHVHPPYRSHAPSEGQAPADGSGGDARPGADAQGRRPRGDAASIMGPSGSGKSTLLYILGALEPPTSGSVTLDGRNPFLLTERELAAFRNKEVGFIFQDHCLLPQCSVLENVLTPTLVAQRRNGSYEARARKLLGDVALA